MSELKRYEISYSNELPRKIIKAHSITIGDAMLQYSTSKKEETCVAFWRNEGTDKDPFVWVLVAVASIANINYVAELE